MPEILKDCKCLDKEDKELFVQALNDAIGFNAHRISVAKERGVPSQIHEEVKRLTIKMRAFDELRDIVKNTPICNI